MISPSCQIINSDPCPWVFEGATLGVVEEKIGGETGSPLGPVVWYCAPTGSEKEKSIGKTSNNDKKDRKRGAEKWIGDERREIPMLAAHRTRGLHKSEGRPVGRME